MVNKKGEVNEERRVSVWVYLITIIAVVALAWFLANTFLKVNLKNAGFEKDSLGTGIADYWISCCGTPGATYSLSSDAAKGKFSQKVDTTTGGVGMFQMPIDRTKYCGKPYTLSAQVKVLNGGLKIAYEADSAKQEVVKTAADASAWTPVVITGNIDCSMQYFSATFYSTEPGSIFLVDDVKFKA